MSATQRRAKREAREAYERAHQERVECESAILASYRGSLVPRHPQRVIKAFYRALLAAERDAKTALDAVKEKV